MPARGLRFVDMFREAVRSFGILAFIACGGFADKSAANCVADGDLRQTTCIRRLASMMPLFRSGTIE